MDNKSFWLGFPMTSKMIWIWLRLVLPGKRGYLLISSARIQPTDHISTALEYLYDPRTISGAQYHLVATNSVITESFSSV